MSLCKDCTIATVWEGTPEGKTVKYGPTDVYIAEPKQGAGDKSKAVLLLTDVFGLGLVNNKLLADDWARAGYYTYVPDLFDGDYLTDARKEDPKFDIMAFIGAHGEEVTHKILDPFVAKLKEDGITSFAALGYCFGARYVFNLSFASSISVGVVNHPSLLRVPDDLQKLSQLSPAVPMLFNTCEVDQMYPAEAQAKGDEILGNGSKEGKAYKRNYYDGCTHGFAVRGDIKDEKVKFGKEDSFKQSVEWLKQHDF